MIQEELGGARRSQQEPGGASGSREEPGGAQRLETRGTIRENETATRTAKANTTASNQNCFARLWSEPLLR